MLGQFIPTVWLGVFGATLATITTATDPGKIVVDAFGALAIPVLLLVIHGPIATNVLNIYSCALCAQTLDWKVERRTLSYGVGVLATLFTIYLILHGDVRRRTSTAGWPDSSRGWHPGARSCWCTTTAVAKQKIDVDALFEPPGSPKVPDIVWEAIIPFLLGIVATWMFEYGIPSYLQGPIAKSMGGIDLSWLAAIHRRRRAVLRRALTTPGTLVDGHRRGLTA